MKIEVQSYNQMKAWFARLVPETFPSNLITAENNPVTCLEQMEAKSPAKARTGLAVAIGDIIELADGWPLEKVAAVDELLASDSLPTLTEVRIRFSKVISRVLSRGSIKYDVEYYAVRNAVELTMEGMDRLWVLLAAYEAKQGARDGPSN